MQGIAEPVGDLPPEIYWKRRAMAAALLVLVIMVLIFLTKPLFNNSAEPAPTTTANPFGSVTPTVTTSPLLGVTATPDPTASGSILNARACGPDDLQFILVPVVRNVSSGISPSFEVQVTHIGFTECVLNTDTEDVEMAVTSGADRVWNSTDCAAPSPVLPQRELLAPDDTTSLSATWPRIRSNTECSSSLPAPASGTYRATVSIDGILSDEAVFTLS